jgi:hypothetical protein
LKVVATGCACNFEEILTPRRDQKITLVVTEFTPDSRVDVTGFDTRRELDTRIRTQGHAPQN